MALIAGGSVMKAMRRMSAPQSEQRNGRACMALQVTPVFAPPSGPGFQNAIEGFNALWQSKVWHRHHCPNVASLEGISARYIAAYRGKTATRRDRAPPPRAFPKRFKLDLNDALNGTVIFVRRSDENGNVHMLGHSYLVDKHWLHRLVHCEVDFIHHQIRFIALRRRAPDQQTLLRALPYHRPNKPFKGKP